MKNLCNPDVIAIYGGTNDAVGAAEVGEYKYSGWTADDLKTFRPAYAYMLDYLKTNHPNAKIVVNLIFVSINKKSVRFSM